MMLNEMHQEDKTRPRMPEEHSQSFDVAMVKYINPNSITLVLFTKLESSKSQRWTKITYKIDSGADGNFMPFKTFKGEFTKTTVELLHTTH